MNELVSVIIPAYNHGKFISYCLDSIINQTYKEIELIIINDASSDNTHQRIMDYEVTLNKRFVNYTYLNNQYNQGICKSLNRAMKLVKGEYVCYFASDDMMYKDRLQVQVETLVNRPDVDVVYSNCVEIRGEGDLTRCNEITKLYMAAGSKIEGKGAEFVFQNLPYIPAPTVLYRKKCFDIVGEFDEDLLAEDIDMIIRMGMNFKLLYIDKIGAIHRLHGNNLSGNKGNLEIIGGELINKYNTEKGYSEIFHNLLEGYAFKMQQRVYCPEDRKLIIWGTGGYYQNNKESIEKEIEFFIDNNKEKDGEMLDGKKVYSPSILKNISVQNEYWIAVLSIYYNEIYAELDKLGLKLGKDYL